MPTYRVFIDGAETENFVSGHSYVDAYFDVASSFPLKYRTKVRLEEIDPD
ncbi:MAG: hypothetical protein P4N41_24020 [Negativicutes bacterium]|nr:hypothetical protein [Negativicutes bacterium]